MHWNVDTLLHQLLVGLHLVRQQNESSNSEILLVGLNRITLDCGELVSAKLSLNTGSLLPPAEHEAFLNPEAGFVEDARFPIMFSRENLRAKTPNFSIPDWNEAEEK